MKRFNLLLIALSLVTLTAVGYPNSHVIKETPTYQEVVKASALNQHVVSFASVDVEQSIDLVIDAPWLGDSNTEFVRRAAKDSNGFSSDLRKPPRYRCQKLGFNNIEKLPGLL